MHPLWHTNLCFSTWRIGWEALGLFWLMLAPFRYPFGAGLATSWHPFVTFWHPRWKVLGSLVFPYEMFLSFIRVDPHSHREIHWPTVHSHHYLPWSNHHHHKAGRRNLRSVKTIMMFAVNILRMAPAVVIANGPTVGGSQRREPQKNFVEKI